jgi:predicted aspartyl protease
MRDALAAGDLKATVDPAGRPTAPVTLNGKGPFRFRVDTGATASVITQNLVDEIGAPIEGQQLVHGTTGDAMLSFARVDRLTVGSVTKRRLPVSVVPSGTLPRIDGILGADVFAGQLLVFDIREKRVQLADPQTVRPVTSRARNMFLRNDLMAEVEGRVGRIAVRLMLDTGADFCIVNSALSDFLHHSYPESRRFGRGTITGVTGQPVTGAFLALPQVRFADLTLTDALGIAADVSIFDVWGLDKEPAMIVGVDVFSRLSRCIFDYSRGRFDAFVMGPEQDIAPTMVAHTGQEASA